MTKSRHGNKEAKKPKKAPVPVDPTPLGVLPLAVAPAVRPRKK